MFRKEDIQDDNSYGFIKSKLSDEFHIPDDERSKVIFGYNGIGKTTIFRFLKEYKDDDRLMFLDYIDSRDSFIKNKKKLLVSANVNRINELETEINTIKSDMAVRDTIKSVYGITNATLARNYGAKMVSAQKNDTYTDFSLSRTDIQEAADKLEHIPSNFIVANKDIIEEANTLNEEVESFKSSYIYKALVPLSEVINTDDSRCPICDSDVNNIHEIIHEKLEMLSGVNSEILNRFKQYNIEISERNLNRVVETISILNNDDKLTDWIICNGNVERYDMLVRRKIQLREKETELSRLEQQRDDLYQKLKESELSIKDEISSYFGVEQRNIKFSNSKKTLTILLPREVNTYSTGEMNFLSFVFRIYDFIGSDKEILILDDPVSSLDIINHYKIAYRLVKTATSKTVVILTHSVELLNTISSQFGDDFDFYYIEEDSDDLIIQNIESVRTGENILTLNRLISQDEKRIIEALIQKESFENSDEIHKLFHYSGSFSHDDYTDFDNEYLVDIIENYQTIQNTNFLENTYKKVITIASVRVWVEKQMRDLIHDEVVLSNYDEKCTITQKINYLFPRTGDNRVETPLMFSREKLMSYKVMMNQGIHYQSQVMPFAYALNVSIVDLNKEIEQIKKLFRDA